MEEQFRGSLREMDFFREFLEEVAEALDEKIGRLAQEALACPDPDGFGISDPNGALRRVWLRGVSGVLVCDLCDR